MPGQREAMTLFEMLLTVTCFCLCLLTPLLILLSYSLLVVSGAESRREEVEVLKAIKER